MDQREKNSDRKLPETLDFMSALWGVHHALQSSSKRLEQKSGVTGPQRLVLRIVGEFPHASAGDIAQTLRIHPSTLTGVLRRLETRGLIERKPDPQDARRALLSLTREGARVNTIDAGTPEAAIRRALASVSSDDADATRRTLERVAAALGSLDAG